VIELLDSSVTIMPKCGRCNASVSTKKAVEENGSYYCNESCKEDKTQSWRFNIGGYDPISYLKDKS